MNIFEELIEELKEEHLLEETVIETNNSISENTYNQPFIGKNSSLTFQAETLQNETTTDQSFQTEQVSENLYAMDSIAVKTNGNSENYLGDFDAVHNTKDFIEEPDEALAFKTVSLENKPEETAVIDDHLVQNLFQEKDSLVENILKEEAEILNSEESLIVNPIIVEEAELGAEKNSENPLLSKDIPNDSNFFRRRATEEVTSLQIVEHIISAIEKEHKKVAPNPYNDLPVSMALHDFLKVTENPHSPEHTQAEFKLMQETESWYSALSQRDTHISVGDLRKYCENARPALSSQALISLARFYRNSPFSEVVRGKFDMVLTRLLTKEKWNDTREMIFSRDELITQIGNLYADWSSIPLYEANEDDSDVLIGVLKFEDFAEEAKNASNFDELIKNDFFNRLKIYKESTGEKFFAPLLTATVIESNVVIGNKYVELIQQEREKNNSKLLEEKYSFLLDQTVSDATSKTLQLIEVLKEKKEPPKTEHVEVLPEIKEVVVLEKSKKGSPYLDKSIQKQKKFKVNKALVAIIGGAICVLAGIFVWAEYFTPQMKTSPSVVKVNLDNSSLKEYFKTARISKSTFFAVTEPSWDKLSQDVKEDVLKKTLSVGSEKGYNKIHVMNSEGKTIAFASDQGITIDPK